MGRPARNTSMRMLLAAFLSCLAAGSLAATPNFEQTKLSVKDLATPQNQTVQAGSVWYRCGLGSAQKIILSVTSSVKLDTFIAAGEADVKAINFGQPTTGGISGTLDNLEAKAKYQYEGGTYCQQQKTCEKTVGGRLLIYDRCLAVSNVRAGDGSPAAFTVSVRIQRDTLVLVIWIAIALGIGMFILGIACCLCKCLTCCCCC